jgi:hypothetical protein
VQLGEEDFFDSYYISLRGIVISSNHRSELLATGRLRVCITVRVCTRVCMIVCAREYMLTQMCGCIAQPVAWGPRWTQISSSHRARWCLTHGSALQRLEPGLTAACVRAFIHCVRDASMCVCTHFVLTK